MEPGDANKELYTSILEIARSQIGMWVKIDIPLTGTALLNGSKY